MKFIHTSDWHIGRQFHHVSLLEDQRFVLDQIVEFAAAESVDALLIAGDIYDRSVPPAAAVELLDDVLKRLCVDLKIPVILIPGNHDSAERVGFGSHQLKQAGLHILADLRRVAEPVVIQKGNEVCHFYGIPYNDPEHVRNCFDADASDYQQAHEWLMQEIKPRMDDQVANIVISHSFVAGGTASESERPLSIGGADQVSADLFECFDYAALGHLHEPQSKTSESIRYSGSIMKYSFSEQHHDKGMTLVEFEHNRLSKIDHVSLKPLRDMRIIEGTLSEVLEAGRVDPNADDYVMVRLTDTQAILDAMGKLRTVYPNTLHLEKPGLLGNADAQSIDREKLKRGELEMFSDFFQQMTGNPLSDEQTKAVQQTIESVHNAKAAKA